MKFNLFNKRELPTSSIAPDEPTDKGKGVSYGESAVQINDGFYSEASLSVSAFHRAVELRSKTMGQLVWEYQIKTPGGNFVKAISTERDKHLNYLLSVRPNPLTTACKMQEDEEIAIMMTGNAVKYIERDAFGEVIALWLCRTYLFNKFYNTYDVTYEGVGGEIHLTGVPANDILHVRNTFSFNGGLDGISTLRYAANTLSISATSDKLTLENAAKGGKLKLLLQEEKKATMGLGKVSKKEMEKVRTELEDKIYQQDVIFLNNIAGVTPISSTAQNMELLESRKFGVSEIARLTGVPKVMLMDDSGSSYKSPEAATQEFLLRTISPKIREWECEMNSKLIGERNYGGARFHLCDKALMRLDPSAQADLYKEMLEMGAISVNEIRNNYDMGNVKDGDIHYISTNLAQLGSDKLKEGKA